MTRFLLQTICLSMIGFFFASSMQPLPVVADEKKVVVPVYSVQEFLEQKTKWPQLKDKKIKIEGRYSGLGTHNITMTGSKMVFHLSEDVFRPKGRSHTVKITGSLKRKNNRWSFDVTHIQERPTDMSRLKTKISTLTKDDPKPWYALSLWTANRAKFYNDSNLEERAEELKLRGIKVATDLARNSTDGEKFLEIASQTAKLDLPERMRFEYLHEGLQKIWNQRKKQKTFNRKKFLKRVSTFLPGCLQPQDSISLALKKEYAKSPLSTYNKGSNDRRSQLHRLFYAKILLEEILSLAKKDGSNGDDIAEQLRKLMPDGDAGLHKKYDQQSLDYRFEGLASATRKEAVRLADDFKKLGQEKKSRTTLENWLATRRKRTPKNDYSELIQIAEGYEELLKDKKTSLEILFAVWKAQPNSIEVKSLIEKKGLKLFKGEWLETDAYKKKTYDPFVEAMKKGKILPGMSRTQVFKVQGNPTALMRIASADGITEQWTYANAGIIIRFHRTSVNTPPVVKTVQPIRSFQK